METIKINKTTEEFAELTKDKFLVLSDENGNESVWIKREHAEFIMCEFVRKLVAEGKLQPVNGYQVDKPTIL